MKTALKMNNLFSYKLSSRIIIHEILTVISRITLCQLQKEA